MADINLKDNTLDDVDHKVRNGHASRMELAPAQIRAARALLGWPQKALSERSLVGLSTIKAIEAGTGRPTKANLAAIQHALEAAGVVFTANGVELPPTSE